MQSVKLLTDQALMDSARARTGDPVGRADGLGFTAYAKTLAAASVGTPGPFTIGIFGEWGTGKTSLLRLVQAELKSEEGVLPVWFNAWQYEQDENPIVPLVGTVIHAIESQPGFLRRQKLGQQLIRALRAVAYGFSTRTEFQVPGFAKIEAGFVAKDMIEREAKLTPDPLIERSLYFQAFEALSKAHLTGKSRIVVLIDDLDRCFPDKAIRLLESIKLVLAQPGFIFVLGVAQHVLEAYLEHRYRDFGLDGFRGMSYLDKIIQLPFTIPPHTTRMNKLAEQLLEEIDSESKGALKPILLNLAPHLGGNPRTLVRFINSLLIDAAVRDHTPPEFLEALAVTRILEQRWRPFYHVVSRSRTLPDIDDILKEDVTLREFVATEACQKWLNDYELRLDAVEFLRTTPAQPRTQGLFQRNAQVTTVVDSDFEHRQDASLMAQSIHRQERAFNPNHKTYLRENAPPLLTGTVVYALLAGADPPPYYRSVPLPPPEQGSTETRARLYLEYLFGT